MRVICSTRTTLTVLTVVVVTDPIDFGILLQLAGDPDIEKRVKKKYMQYIWTVAFRFFGNVEFEFSRRII